MLYTTEKSASLARAESADPERATTIAPFSFAAVAYASVSSVQENWGKIYRAVTSANAITFYSTEKTTVNIPVQIKVVG